MTGKAERTTDIRTVPRFMRAVEVATYIGSTEGTIRVWTSQRKIPFVKKGRYVRYDRLAIDAWMQKDAVKPLAVWDQTP